jgi:hypothetical protein
VPTRAVTAAETPALLSVLISADKSSRQSVQSATCASSARTAAPSRSPRTKASRLSGSTQDLSREDAIRPLRRRSLADVSRTRQVAGDQDHSWEVSASPVVLLATRTDGVVQPLLTELENSHMSMRLAIVPFAVLVALTGCAPQNGFGRVGIQASALTQSGSITSVVVESGSATTTLVYDSTKSKYSGSIALPVGQQHITVKAYANTQLAGQGAADVVIEQNKTTAVTVRVLDVTGGQKQVPAGPFITGVTAASSSAITNQALGLTVTAVDGSGDAISYAWTASCAGTFSAQAASTSFTPTATGACHISVTATANSLNDTETLDTFVFAPSNDSGAASIDAEYAPSPSINYIEFFGGNISCNVFSTSADSMCRTIFPNANLSASVGFTNYGTGSVTVTDNCGGKITKVNDYVFSYVPVLGLCTLTAKVVSGDNLSSSLSASIYVK